MSTVMYAYRVPNSQLWPFLDALRAYYVENDMAYKIMRQIRTDPQAAYTKARMWANRTDLYVTVQLFQDGDTWLLRVLEDGYFFLNHWQQFTAYLTPVFYDDRTDVPPAEEANEPIAERLDAQIASKHYLLAVIVDRDEMLRYFSNLPIFQHTEDT